MKGIIKNTKGITLIALVVTIIILLILAGVAINVAIGDNGLFRKSQNAVERYKAAESNETKVLDEMSSEIAKADILNKVTGEEQNNTKVTIDGQNVWIPAGFKISDETAEKIDGGIVVEDKKGNEWVWVPCTEVEFKRTAFEGGEEVDTDYTDYSEEMPTEQYNSIKTYGGFYIGRYEAGANEEVSGEDTTRKVLIQKNKHPYNYISIADVKTKSNNFASANEYNEEEMFTTLCSSYAWDSAITFIEKTNAGYATNSTQGNYSSASLKNTGLTTAVCNIYDMGGNLWEYTSEYYSGSSNTCVSRGGYYCNDSSGLPAGSRNNSDGSSYGGGGFRLTLFLKERLST